MPDIRVTKVLFQIRMLVILFLINLIFESLLWKIKNWDYLKKSPVD